MDRLRLRCYRCNYEWFPNESISHGMPQTCPKCRSKLWWKEKKQNSGPERKYHFIYSPSPEFKEKLEQAVSSSVPPTFTELEGNPLDFLLGDKEALLKELQEAQKEYPQKRKASR